MAASASPGAAPAGSGAAFTVGAVTVELDDARAGAWGLRYPAGFVPTLSLTPASGLRSTPPGEGQPSTVSRFALDGLSTEVVAGDPPPPAPAHPNGALVVDHVVIVTPSLARTTTAFEAAGLAFRRERDAGPVRQRFVRLGEVVVEVVGPAEDPPEPPEASVQPASVWGITFTVADLDAAVAAARAGGCPVGEPRGAVQPGRRIATVARAAGLPLPVALMSPRA